MHNKPLNGLRCSTDMYYDYYYYFNMSYQSLASIDRQLSIIFVHYLLKCVTCLPVGLLFVSVTKLIHFTKILTVLFWRDFKNFIFTVFSNIVEFILLRVLYIKDKLWNRLTIMALICIILYLKYLISVYSAITRSV